MDKIKKVNNWYFPAEDVGQSSYSNCNFGNPILNREKLCFIEGILFFKKKTHSLDIGANIGYVTSWLSQRWNKVSSFEPTPITFECLRLNCNQDHIDLYNVGLSDREGELNFAVNKNKPDHNQIVSEFKSYKKGWDVLKIPVKTVDDFNLDDVDFIKIDVEGHEYQVVNGALNTIKKCRPLIMLEISYENKLKDKEITKNHKQALDVVLNENYVILKQFGYDYILMPKEWHHQVQQF